MSNSPFSGTPVEESITDSVSHMMNEAKHASDQAVRYIEREPLKSVLMAAGVGASVAVVLTLILRPHSR